MSKIRGAGLCVFALLFGAVGQERELSAAPTLTIIQVRDAGGVPITGVRVSARSESGSEPQFSMPNTVARGETDTAGKVSLAGLDPKQKYTLVATAPDARWTEFCDSCELGWAVRDTTLTLAPANVLGGKVLTMKRAPVPYALVHARIGHWSSATIADKAGAFEFKNAPPGNAQLFAEMDSKESHSIRGSQTSVPSDATNAVLLLPDIPPDRVQHLIVRVTTPRGRPVPQGWARFSSKSSRSRGSISSFSATRSLEGGAARSADFARALTVRVSGARSEYGELLPCGPGKAGPYAVGPREEKLVLPVELFITGRVLGPDKKPLVGVRIQAFPPRAFASLAALLGGVHGEDVSDAEGNFRIGGVDTRGYVVVPVSTVEHVGGESKCKGGSENILLTMRAAVAPTLTFKDEAGQPVPGALIRVKRSPRYEGDVDPAAWKIETQTDKKGRAHLQGLDPQQKYLLTAYPPTGMSELLTWEFKRWTPQDLALTFERRREISGVVRDQNKEPVPGARIQWTRKKEAKGTQAAKKKPHKSRAGPDGTYLLKDLRPGRYSLVVRPPSIPRKGAGPAPSDAEFTSMPFVVRAGTTDVVLKLKMPDTITLRVWGWDKSVGKPTLLISANGDEGSGPKSLTKRLDKNGMLVIKGLRWNVSYALWMSALKHGKYAYAEEVRPQAEKVSMRVTDGKSVKGKFSSPKGTKARKVWAVMPGFRIRGKVKAGGRFEITGLPPGPWTLRGCGKYDGALLETDVTCKEGEEPVITLKAK